MADLNRTHTVRLKTTETDLALFHEYVGWVFSCPLTFPVLPGTIRPDSSTPARLAERLDRKAWDAANLSAPSYTRRY